MRLLDRLLELAACTLLVAIFVVVLLGVITRAWGEPLIWTDEGARFLMVWLACVAWMLATRRRGHVRIRYFQNLLPAGLHRVVERVIQVALAVFGVAIAVFAVTLVRRNWELEATSLPLSMGLLYAPLVPAGLLMAVQAATQAIERPASPIGESVIE